MTDRYGFICESDKGPLLLRACRAWCDHWYFYENRREQADCLKQDRWRGETTHEATEEITGQTTGNAQTWLTADDIQHARMLKDASVAGTPAPASLNGTLPTIQHPERDDAEGWIDKRKRQDPAVHSRLDSPRRSIDSTRSTSKDSIDTLGSLPNRAKTPESSRTTPPLSRADSIAASSGNTLTRHRSPSVVTGLNPSPVRAVTGKDHLTVSARGASSLMSNISTTTSSPPLSASLAKLPSNPNTGNDAKASRATISSLLDQLTEIHDRQQDERKAEWDAFLRKRQKALAAANGGGSSGKRGKKDGGRSGRGGGVREGGGEVVGVGLIGIGQMGRSGKEEERKSFGRLVRGGIPLAYRSDIWAGKSSHSST